MTAPADARVDNPLGITAFDHVAVAVRDLARACELYVDALGGRFVVGGDNDGTGVRIVHLVLGGFKLELMQPLRDQSLIAPFLAARGEGFHHVTFRSGDLEATLATAGDLGLGVTGADLDNPAWRELFLKPRTTQGALVQIVDTDHDWSTPVPGLDLEAVLAGRAVFRRAVPCLRTEGL